MKKLLFAIIITGIMLTGCGSGNNNEMQQIADEISNVTVNEVYDTISALSSEKMVVLDDSLIENYYGINTSDFSEYIFAQAESPMSAETIIIAKAKEDVDISTYKNNIDNVIEQKIDEMNNYNLPEQAELLDKAEKKFNNNSLYVVISKEAPVMAETIEIGLGI